MNEGSRTKKSIVNVILALSDQAVTAIVQFICRTVFIRTLGKTYLGFSGLFSDILTMLSLADLGISTAIIYSMYKPVAVGDNKKTAALLNFYKKVYSIIGIVITCIGLCLTPFLKYVISDIPNLPEIPLIYILYLLNTSCSYFFVYKKSILITYQENRIVSIIDIVVVTGQNVAQIIALLLTHNFIIYLVIQVVFTILNNFCVSLFVDKHYTFLRKYKNEKIDDKEKNTIWTNVKAMFTSKLSSTIVTSTDNLLISTFVSTTLLGLYSNYTMFVNVIRLITQKIFEGLTGSVGNLVALESSNKIYDVFQKIWFVNFWIVSFCTVTLYVLVNPFIELWVGKDYLLGKDVVFIVCLNLYMRLIRNTFITFEDTFGLFVELRIKCVAEAIINFVVSLIFVEPLKMGIYGVLLGTFVSNITTSYWYEPYLLFAKKFGIGMGQYFKQFFIYFASTVSAACICGIACNAFLNRNSWIMFAIRVLFCVVFINTYYILLFHKSDEYLYFKSLILRKVKKQ